VNKNSLPRDTRPLTPSGLRLGTPAMTTRGMRAEGFAAVARLLARGIEASAAVQRAATAAADPPPGARGATLAAFRARLDAGEQAAAIAEIGAEARELALQFPHPSVDA
jgi:glycine hydroxymethyltransferase